MKRKAAYLICVGLAACNGEGGRATNQTSEEGGGAFVAGPEAPFSQRIDSQSGLQSCVLPGGTMGIPDPLPTDIAPDLGNGVITAISKPAPEDAPKQVYLRTDTETYNRRYQFILRDGSVWYKRNTEQAALEHEWVEVPTPGCLEGTLIGISADDDELIAIRKDGGIYGLDNILKDPLFFNWTSRWGPIFWTGPGRDLPEDYRAWSWTVISNGEDENWTDPAGNQHRVGDAKCSHIWVLGEDGQRFTYLDPWLPDDESYEMCGPLRGRFKAVNLSASGSTIMAINRYGDIYTRHYDFDLAGADNYFLPYSYDDQRGVKNPKIQLPIFDWTRQPKIPGQITHQISIHKVGKNMVHRIMRVEGIGESGVTGYWERDIAEAFSSQWRFIETGEPLRGTLLENSQADTSGWDVGQNEDAVYSYNLSEVAHLDPDMALESEADWAAEIPDFNLHCSPSTLRVITAPNESMELFLHTTDVIRQLPRARGFDENPRQFKGSVEIPTSILDQLDSLSARQRGFLQLYLNNQRFTDVKMFGTIHEISVEPSGVWSGFKWTFYSQ